MARISKNIFLDGVSGSIDKQVVYRTQGDTTIVSKMPRIDPNREPTEGQQEQRDKFSEASDYAQEVMGDPDLNDIYKEKSGPGKTVRSLAIRDFLKAPVVNKIDHEAYTGAIDGVIRIKAKDDFRVASVSVGIFAAGGELLEQGEAVLDTRGRKKWLYTTTVANPTLAGTKILVTAFDIPGNEGTLEVTI